MSENVLLNEIVRIQISKEKAGIVPQHVTFLELSGNLHWDRDEIFSSALRLEAADKIRIGRTINDLYVTTDLEDLFSNETKN